LSLQERELNTLGAMGAGQWSGQYMTRPHALLNVRNYTRVEEWVKELPRGNRRNLAKAAKQNFSVTRKLIEGGKPAPHSTLAHFRCVVEHEVRLLAHSEEDLADALETAIFRYITTLRQAGEIYEYRDEQGQVIAFAHEVRKGSVIRGQWFYGDNIASRSYVWFHSVQELVKRAIEAHDVDIVDLGPSGNDGFTRLKESLRFTSVEDWHLSADYTGAFKYGDEPSSVIGDIKQTLLERPRILLVLVLLIQLLILRLV